ncbi:MAG: hypothetical protein K8R54_04830 [Bacteroidales bacterium]|nr:hypothetical protein [Bacteroidales bacterium]
MKNLVYFVVLVLLFSCGNSENDNNNQVEVTEEESNIVENSTSLSTEQLIIGDWICTILQGGEYIFDDLHTFNADGSFLFQDATYKVEGTWELRDKNLVIIINDKEEIWGEIISINDNKFVVKDDEGKESVYKKH